MNENNIYAGKAGVIGDYTTIKNQIIYENPVISSNKPLLRPRRVSEFTNRDLELDELLSYIQPGKIVTLCGPCGVGKTALVTEALWKLTIKDEIPKDFPDGIIYHNFNQEPQADLALEAFARIFGMEPRPTPRDAAIRALAGKKALIVLDGAEDADNLTTVLNVTGGCGVIITSRRKEDTFDKRLDISPLKLADAIKLLRAWGNEYASEADSVRKICELVGNLPFAISFVGRYLNQMEEPASRYLEWLKTMPLKALSYGREKDSVSTVLAHSIAQVGEDACHALNVLGLISMAPFRHKVLSVGLNLGMDDIRILLNTLLNYGLIIHTGDLFQVSHALIHIFAREQLPKRKEMIQRLSTYYIALVKKQYEDSSEIFTRIELEREHIHNILHLCVEIHEWKVAKELAMVFGEYLYKCGRYTELVTVGKIGVEVARRLNDQEAELGFYRFLGMINKEFGNLKEALIYMEQSVDIARTLGDLKAESMPWGHMGLVYQNIGDLKHAKDFHRRALKLAQNIGCRQKESVHLGNLGLIYVDIGKLRKANSCYVRALEIVREINYREGESIHLGNLGVLYRILGNYKKAIVYHVKAIDIANEIGYRRGEAYDWGALGLVHHNLGEVEKAIDCLEKALEMWSDIGQRWGESITWGYLGMIHRDLGNLDYAIEYHEKALRSAREIGYPQIEANQLSGLGNINYDLGKLETASNYYEQALSIARGIGRNVSMKIRHTFIEIKLQLLRLRLKQVY